jgi:hypothetical protein
MTLSKKKIVMILVIGLLSIGLIAMALFFGLRLLGGSPSQNEPVDSSVLKREEANNTKQAADEAYAAGDTEKAQELYEEALTKHREADAESGQYTEEGAVSNETSDTQLQLEILSNEVQPEEPPEALLPLTR